MRCCVRRKGEEKKGFIYVIQGARALRLRVEYVAPLWGYDTL